MDFPDLKKDDFLSKKSPNGRVPVIEDPNTGITLWESGAILEYLIDQYDKEGKFTIKSTPEKYYLQQWLHFQVSGQGPYYGKFQYSPRPFTQRPIGHRVDMFG